jgi:hypothetical protein
VLRAIHRVSSNHPSHSRGVPLNFASSMLPGRLRNVATGRERVRVGLVWDWGGTRVELEWDSTGARVGGLEWD